MDRLWFFSETGKIYGVPHANSIVTATGTLKDGVENFEIPAADASEFFLCCENAEQIILVAGNARFDAAFLASIPPVMPRLGLICADSMAEARNQLTTLEPILLLFAPFKDDSVNISLKQAYEDKLSINALQEELKNYSSIAFTAMSSASEMGVVVCYAQAVQNIADMNRLAQQTLRSLKDLAVQGYIQFSFDDEDHVFPQEIPITYRNLLETSKSSSHRIVSHGRFLIFNFDNAQFLITDAPVDDPDKYGRLRDVIAHIVSIAEARAKTIKANTLLKTQQDNTRMVMMLLEMASRDNRLAVRAIMTELSLALREMAMGLELTLEQEQLLLGLSEGAMESLESLHESTDAIEVHFRSLLLQLDQAAKLLEAGEEDTAPATQTVSVELF